MRSRIGKVLFALLAVAGCNPFGKPVPNEDLVNACRAEPPNWRHQTVFADTVLVAEWVNLLDPRLHWTNTSGIGSDFCARCVTLLLSGYSSIEYLPRSAPNLDTVSRYTFVGLGDPHCYNGRVDQQLPPGKCLVVVPHLPRTARYAFDFYDSENYYLNKWTYEAVDLEEHRALAHAVEFYQSGGETPLYECSDVHADRGDGGEFVEESIHPNGPTFAMPSRPVVGSSPEPVTQAELSALRARALQGPTAAQLAGATLIEEPPWIARPTGDEVTRYYPRDALTADLSGRVILDCLVNADGSLRCAIAEETPSGAGFGLAGLGIVEAFRLPPLIDGAPTVGKRVRVPITFRVQPHAQTEN